ncbi:MAG TPA: SEC-C metal-binding domain-containing protein, partial [Patescibacteria group bacterium]|nr:SEC-C metal-binding domain-containing protein [Patescibacteria group bacterium]
QVVYSVYKIGVASQMAPSMMQQARGLTFSAPAKTGEASHSAIAQAANAQTPQEREAASRQTLAPQDDQGHFQGKKVGRNDPCPCGSGKKFKKCHGI